MIICRHGRGQLASCTNNFTKLLAILTVYAAQGYVSHSNHVIWKTIFSSYSEKKSSNIQNNFQLTVRVLSLKLGTCILHENGVTMLDQNLWNKNQ